MSPPLTAVIPPADEDDLAEDLLGEEDELDASATLVTGAHAPGERPTIIEHKFVVESECHGWRLDRFLQKKMKRMSRSRVQRVIEGDCDVEGRPARSGMRVFRDQTVKFRRAAPVEPEVPRDLPIALSDPRFYVFEKPAGLPIHPSARYHFSTLTAVLRERYPGERLQVAHRLDRETSGLILVARDDQAGSTLKRAFARRLVHKRYLAVVCGVIPDDTLVLDSPIGPDGGEVRVRMAIRALDRGGQVARTEVRVLRRLRNHTLVECLPYTGRQHQIRVHLWAHGFPIAGDKLYPDEGLFLEWSEGGWDAVKDRLPLSRHALHAAGLSFPHPTTGEQVEASSELPADIAAFLREQDA